MPIGVAWDFKCETNITNQRINSKKKLIVMLPIISLEVSLTITHAFNKSKKILIALFPLSSTRKCSSRK